MKRSEILEAARRCVCGEREQDYGTPENNFETIGLLWGVYLRAAHPEYAKVMPALCWPCSRWPASPPAPALTALLIWRAMRPAPVKS